MEMIMIYMVTVYEDDKECRFYFPNFKEGLKFKRIVKAEPRKIG